MKVLIVVDMQYDFINGSLGTDEAKKIVPNVVRELNSDEYDAVFVTMDTHHRDYLDTLEGKNLPIEHCIINTNGWFLHKDIHKAIGKKIEAGELVKGDSYDCIHKPTFGSLKLADVVSSINNVESITFVGLCTDICVISNALILRSTMPNVNMYYVEDAVAATTPENQKAAFKVLNACQIYPKK